MYRIAIDVWKYSTFLLKASPWREPHDLFLCVDSGCKAAWAADQGGVSFQTLNLSDPFGYGHWVSLKGHEVLNVENCPTARFSTAMPQELGSSYREERNAMTAEDPISEACWNILNASTCVYSDSISRASKQSKHVWSISTGWQANYIVLQALHPSNLFLTFLHLIFLLDMACELPKDRPLFSPRRV